MKKIISLILSLTILFGSINNTSFGSVATPVTSSQVKSDRKPIYINRARKRHIKRNNKISNKEIMLGVTLVSVIGLVGYLFYKINKKNTSDDSNTPDTSENKSFIKFKMGGKNFYMGYQ